MRHKMKFVAVRHYTFERGFPQTVVLYRCDCGCKRTKTKTMDGHWSAAQLGENA